MNYELFFEKFNRRIIFMLYCYPHPPFGLVPLKEGQCRVHRNYLKELSPFKGDERRERSDGAEGVITKVYLVYKSQ